MIQKSSTSRNESHSCIKISRDSNRNGHESRNDQDVSRVLQASEDYTRKRQSYAKFMYHSHKFDRLRRFTESSSRSTQGSKMTFLSIEINRRNSSEWKILKRKKKTNLQRCRVREISTNWRRKSLKFTTWFWSEDSRIFQTLKWLDYIHGRSKITILSAPE